MILTLKSPGTSVKASQSHRNVTDLWYGQIPWRGYDAALTLILTYSSEKSWIRFTGQYHYFFKEEKQRYGLFLHKDAQCGSAFKKWTYICPHEPQSQWDAEIYGCPNVCIQNQNELLKIDMFFNEAFLVFKLIVPIKCKLFCIFTVSKCQ